MRDLSRLDRKSFDLLVIGGGIVGAGIAWDASLRGLSCALVEQGDFGSGTSSKTTKLIHGGIRYLENLDIGLVRESLKERQTLLARAPSLVRPLPFLIPVAGASPRPWPAVKLGVFLYDLIAGDRRIKKHSFLSGPQVPQAEPLLSGGPFRNGALYYDAQMDDARLVLEVLKAAVKAGTAAANYVKVSGFLSNRGVLTGAQLEDRLSGTKLTLDAKVIINATGPWSDTLRALADPAAKPIVRPSKGIHIVYPQIGLRQALLLSSPKDGRIFFLIPWRELTLIGTTDTDFTGDPGQAQALPEEVDYLIDGCNKLLPRLRLERKAVITTFAGVRPLAMQEKKDPTAVGRSHLIHEDINGMISIAGGKFTTFRKTAQETVDLLSARFLGMPLKPCRTSGEPLGVAAPGQKSADRLVRRYGDEGAALIRRWTGPDPRLAETICPHQPFTRAEVRWAVEKEMAVSAGDILWRRFQTGYSSCEGVDAVDAVVETAAASLGWDEAEKKRQVKDFKNELLSHHQYEL